MPSPDGVSLLELFIEHFQLRRPLTDNVDDDIDDKSVKRHCIALLLRIVTIFADDIKVYFLILFILLIGKYNFKIGATNINCSISVQNTSTLSSFQVVFISLFQEQAGVILEFCLTIRPFLSLMQLASCMQVIAALSNLCVDFATQNNFLSNALSDSLCYFLQADIQE